MKYIQLNTGAYMPLVGLGTWDLNGQECINTVAKAIKLGYRLIDTAQMYHNEREVGLGIIKSGMDRKELFITTKIYGISNSYKKAKEAIDRSLKNLQLDYIDLMLLHEPYKEEDEMYKALIEAMEQGKVKAIGISNYDGSRYETFIAKTSVIPAVNQVECHLLFQKFALQKIMEKHGTAMQAWSPLSQGKVDLTSQPLLQKLAAKYHKTPAQISLRFLVQRNISVIPKSKHESRLKENIDIFDFKLTKEEMKEMAALDTNKTLFPWTECF